MEPMYAACGLDCRQCEAYIATQSNDLAAKEAVLAKWRVELNMPDMPLEVTTCDGCMEGTRHGGYCNECALRKCALERGLPTCAHCPDYTCDPLEGFIKNFPQIRTGLDAIRATL